MLSPLLRPHPRCVLSTTELLCAGRGPPWLQLGGMLGLVQTILTHVAYTGYLHTGAHCAHSHILTQNHLYRLL